MDVTRHGHLMRVDMKRQTDPFVFTCSIAARAWSACGLTQPPGCCAVAVTLLGHHGQQLRAVARVRQLEYLGF